MSSELSQRGRAERAMKRSREAKREIREFDRQTEFGKIDRVNKGNMDARRLSNEGSMDIQRLQNQGYMDITKLKEEGDWGRHKSELDWRTGDAARNFTQRENQFDREFQQTQSIADRSADQWTKHFEEIQSQNKINRFDKGVADRMAWNVNPMTGEANPNQISYDQAAQDTAWSQSFYGKTPDEISSMRRQAGVGSILRKWDSMDATGKKKLFGSLPDEVKQELYATGKFHYGLPSQSSGAPESVTKKTKTYRRPFADAVQSERGYGASGIMGEQEDKGFWKRGKTLM